MRALAALLLWLALALPGWADAPRILMLGDSLTAGFGLPASQSLPRQLERWLADRGTPATIINGGLSGDTSYGGRVRIGPALRRHQPDAVIVELGANDMLMGLPPARTRANLAAILSRAAAGGRPVLLVGIGAPTRDRALRARWAAIWPALAQGSGARLMPDLYAPITAVPPAARGPLLQRDGLHPSASGTAALAHALGPHVQALIAGMANGRTAADIRR